MNELIDLTINDTSIDTAQHSMTIFGICLSSRGKRFLELGVREGYTTAPMLMAVQLLGGKLTSVDIQNSEFTKQSRQNWEFIQSDALEFLESTDEIYDVIFVDDWHSYPHVRRELELISQKHMHDQTIIMMHDCMGSSHHPNYWIPISSQLGDEWEAGGPAKALLELDKNKWEYATLPWNHGLTILTKKPKIVYS